ncbi:MAG TPA: fumarate hydratase [Syntrophorhabdus sp.]|jgi:fumarate hydratase subunit alpha|nr:fumarate hydratase [Syntrophorhabdus sp.]OQB74051.1 MAG: L(+)-tartrate dehydratase subunit alpha [Deltaproteobacteria bacterium ADurb.Bin135]MBP8744721.1 fumarate hydratase [Syntrophorhabdus sp.]HNQ45742.1 fumarate hydratase [Syntrophorhabdus sp.]HOD77303.1 fumarate hydratase [Syntrophorhabdus sp.]
MKEVHVDEIVSVIEKLFIDANYNLSQNVLDTIKKSIDKEESSVGKEVLRELIKNANLARDEHIPICQDTGLAVTFMEVGQDVHIIGGSLNDAINEGVRRGYAKGYLRKSACHPFTRKNTGDNTPAIIHVKIVPGDKIKITVLPKGGGSENYGSVRMLVPSEGKEGVKTLVLEMVTKGGPNPCPPIIVGVGIGGNFETSALLSKEALMEPLGKRSDDPEIAALEEELLLAINKTGIGPQGYGGIVTALDVHVKMMPCHIASLPVAVNIQCHAHRIKEAII